MEHRPLRLVGVVSVACVLLLSTLLLVTASGPAGVTPSHSHVRDQGERHATAHSVVGEHRAHRHHGQAGAPATEEGERLHHAHHSPPGTQPPSAPRSFDACHGQSYAQLDAAYDYCAASFFTAATYTVPQSPSGQPMQLAGLQLLTRHGDRTPVNILPSYDVAYDLCNNTQTLGFYSFAAPSEEASGEGPTSSSTRKQRRTRRSGTNEGRRLERIPVLSGVSVSNPFASQLWQGSCMSGQLTTRGIQQLQEIGSNLRAIYVDRLGFLPATYSRANTSFYLRTTDVWRTRQSAESLLTGLWPASDLEDEVIPLHSYPAEIETMYANSLACDALARIQTVQFQSAEWTAHLDAPAIWNQLDAVLGTGSLPDWKEGYDHYYDNFKTRQCHGLPLPCQPGNPENCITQETADFVYAQGDWEYQFLMLNSTLAPQVASLGIGAFLAAIRDVLLAQVTGTPSPIGSPAFAYYSGHDTTLGAVLGALNVTGFRWPPYASNMLFELWLQPPQAAQTEQAFATAAAEEATLDAPAPTDYSVRVLYNGGVLPMYAAGCCDDLCPFERFIDYLNQIIPPNLVELCRGDGLRKKVEEPTPTLVAAA